MDKLAKEFTDIDEQVTDEDLMASLKKRISNSTAWRRRRRRRRR